MTWLICFTATIILFALFNMFQVDANSYLRYSNSLKYVAESASFNGAQYLNSLEYANGLLVFNDAESLESIESTICSKLRLDANMVPVGYSLTDGPFEYTVYFIDESLEGRIYKNGSLKNSFSFSFPYNYTDSTNGFVSEVYKPTIFVKVEAGELPIRGFSTRRLKLDRTASYEVTERE